MAYNYIPVTFPPQQALSITETLPANLPQFVPHEEIIFIGISDLFSHRLTALSASDQSYLDSLKSSSDTDKAMASEIAHWHHQIDYAKQCVEEIEGNALCKRMQLMLNEERKQIKEGDAQYDAFQQDDEHKFVLLDYNLQTFSGSTSDAKAIGNLLQKEAQNMQNLLANNTCSWRFHLIYAELLTRISLDNKAVQAQIDLAQTKLGSDANSHYGYLALIGDIYLKLRQMDAARDALSRACLMMKNDGYCRTRLIYSYLYEKKFDLAHKTWMACVSDLKTGGISDEILNSYTLYLRMYENLDDEGNNEAIMSNEQVSFVGTPLKLFVIAYKTGKYDKERSTIMECAEYESSTQFTAKDDALAEDASHGERMMASFIKMCVDMWANDDGGSWEVQGPGLDNVFSTFPRPLLNDMLDALCLEEYMLGMFKLRWKGDCKNAFRFSMTCNCRFNMNSYIGEVIGFQNAGNSDTAVEKIAEISTIVNVDCLKFMPIDAKRMREDDEDGRAAAEVAGDLVAMIAENALNYDAMLALADIYISGGKWQSAMLVMQPPICAATLECSKNLELKMKWATVLYFNGFVPLAFQIFRDYVKEGTEAAAHNYYMGLAASIFLDLGKFGACDKIEDKFKPGGNIWALRFFCNLYWMYVAPKKDDDGNKMSQPKKGKPQYAKSIDCAKKMIRLAEDHPLGHALLARSMASPKKADKVEESVNKAVELADQFLASKQILPQLYYESMIHCGVAMYQCGKDGSAFYNKACDNAPHGETLYLKIQREKITAKLSQGKMRTLLLGIVKKQLKDATSSYKKACPIFEFDVDTAVALSKDWDLFSPHAELKSTDAICANITKPGEAPSSADAQAKPKAKKPKAKKAKPVPDTDDEKIMTKPPVGNRMSVKMEDDTTAAAAPVESPWKYANLCGSVWPEQMMTFNLPFDDAIQMGNALMMLLRKEMSSAAPSDENDLIGRLHWGGDDALQFVLDKCDGKADALHLGLANFAYTYKVDFGIGSDDHVPLIDKIAPLVKDLSYEGKIGYASLLGLQCNTSGADALFEQLSSAKDADGSDWLYHRHYGQYLLMVKHEYSGAVTALEAAYKGNHKCDPMTIGWYLAALSKTGNQNAMPAIFDQIGKYYEKNTDAAVIREEFLNGFDIRNPATFDGLIKETGATDFHTTRKLICCAKYDRDWIVRAGGIGAATQMKCTSKNGKLFSVLVAYFRAQAQWTYNNSLRQCVDGMTFAGQSCMDWTLGNAVGAYCFAKKGELEEADNMVNMLPNTMYDPVIYQAAAMVRNTDVEHSTFASFTQVVANNKLISPATFIARINHLRFTQAKDIDLALRELTTEYLTSFKQDYAALVALADILLSRGAVKAAYRVYFTIQRMYPLQFKSNFILRLKFAECMRLNGYESQALSEFRTVYNCFDKDDKDFKTEMTALTSVLVGFVFLNIQIGDYDMAEKVLNVLKNRHKLCQLAEAYLTLLRDGPAKAGNVFNQCKSQEDNPLMLALAVQSGKMSGEDTSGVEAKLKALLSGKYAGIRAVKEFCEISAGIAEGSDFECLSNAIAAVVVKKADAGKGIYDGLKGVFAKNNCPSHADRCGACGVASGSIPQVDIVAYASVVQIADITDDYVKLNADATKEIEDMKAGKVEQSSKAAGGKKKGKAKGGKSSKKRASFQKDAVAAGPKPVVDYAATPLVERKKWAFQMAESLPAPKSKQVAKWSANEVADFVSKIPIFGLNEWYGNKFRENGVTGRMFLECNEQKLIKWGMDRKCHRARFRAEALAMKRRG